MTTRDDDTTAEAGTVLRPALPTEPSRWSTAKAAVPIVLAATATFGCGAPDDSTVPQSPGGSTAVASSSSASTGAAAETTSPPLIASTTLAPARTVALTAEPPSTEPFVSNAPIGERSPSPTAGDLDSSLQAAMSAVEFETISEATLGEPPRGLEGAWIYLDANVPSLKHGNTALANWEASLLFGALAERASTGRNLADVVGGMEVQFRLPDGTLENAGGRAMVNVAAGQVFGSGLSEEEDRARLQRVLASFELELKSVKYTYPLDRAATIVATAEFAEAVDGRLYKVFFDVTDNLSAYEGAFFELQLRNGAPIARLHGEFRGASGGEWVRPGLEEIVGGRPVPGE